MQQRPLDAIDGLATHPRRGDFRKLQVIEDEWRLRVGEWHVRFTFNEGRQEVHILRVLPRGRAYRD
jgi:mRNA-degrading endonuclease RelE of RelBE toxin-antitoxin system